MLFSPLFFPLGLVESGSERSSGFCARCVCEEAGPRPVSLEGEPPGRTGQHCAAAGANRQPVRACTHTAQARQHSGLNPILKSVTASAWGLWGPLYSFFFPQVS